MPRSLGPSIPRRTRSRVVLLLLACAWLIQDCEFAGIEGEPASNVPVARRAHDLYTGFVLGPKASVDGAGLLWVGGFVFRPTREKRLPVDAAVVAVDVQCSYSRAEFESLFEAQESLVTFSAVEGPDGHLELTSCPVDARLAGNAAIRGDR